MSRPIYYKLKGAIVSAGYNGKEVAALLYMSPPAFSQKLNGRSPWTLDEMYQVLDIIGCEYTRMAELFPPRRSENNG